VAGFTACHQLKPYHPNMSDKTAVTKITAVLPFMHTCYSV
jgi:hypothetical protein